MESALRFARQRYGAEKANEGASEPGSTAYGLRLLWSGRIDAYEYVLKLETGEEPKV